MTTRRDVLKTLTLGGAALMGRSAQGQTLPAMRAAEKEMPLRFVHLTDMHVTAEHKGNEGFAAALKAAHALDPAPAFMITGGDHVMEALESKRQVVEADWKLYRQTLADHNKLKVYSVLGNHDIWGWGIPDQVAETEAGYGKAMALEQLGLKTAYYSFGVEKWHFIILDSMKRRGKSYFGEIDDAQLKWLKADLKAVKEGQHICVVTHIPVLAACVFFDGDRIRPDSWHVPDAWMHHDTVALMELFRAHRVRLAISGHIHLQDRVEYDGVTFICNGAVCGAWWKGSYHETPPGFGVFDLYADGRCDYRYVDFGWKPRD